MDARSTKGSGLLRVDGPRSESAASNGAPRRASLRRIDRPAPEALGAIPRATLEELFQALVREELRPFVQMLHELLERLGRAVHAGDEFLSVTESAKVAHVGESTVRGWIKSGHLKAGKAGRLLRIRRSDLEALIMQARLEKRRPDPEAEAAKILERNRSTER